MGLEVAIRERERMGKRVKVSGWEMSPGREAEAAGMEGDGKGWI